MTGEPSDEERQTAAVDAGNHFLHYFDSNRVLLPEDLCEQFEEVNKILHGVNIDYAMRRDGREFFRAAMQAMDEKVPVLRGTIEARIRGELAGPNPAEGAL